MSSLKELSICKVTTVTGVDMKTAGKTVLYTVPVGKTFIPVMVVIRNPSASLAGGTDYDIGTGANADTWVQANDLSAMTTLTTDTKIIQTGGTKYSYCASSSEFGIKVITGSTAACTAVIDVFGYLF